SRELVNGCTELQSDGSTACGCWIYSGIHPKPGLNLANSRKAKDYLGHGWGYSWPSDRRILYNRASARPDGKPWSERKKLVWWDENKREWTGHDVPDFKKDTPPDYRPSQEADGMTRSAEICLSSCIQMEWDGYGSRVVSKMVRCRPIMNLSSR